MRFGRTLCGMLVAVAMWLVGGDSQAQEVHGRVVDAESDVSVMGAMLIALDPAGEAGGRTLTDDDGDFVLRLPPAFDLDRIQVVRIGYASQAYPIEEQSSDGIILLRIASSPVELEGIGIVADNLCAGEFEGSGQVYDIWLEARKALEMTRLNQTARSLAFDADFITRVLDPDDLSERERRVLPRHLRGSTPYYSLTGEQMTETGWIQVTDGGELNYWAPDAVALLSSAFTEQHCFGAELTDTNILLRFAPNSARQEIPDIKGEVVLERGSHRLQRVRFEYTGIPLPREAAGRAGGEVHFTAAPNGVWAVTEWWIRMPIVTQTRVPAGASVVRRTRIEALREEGGRVLRIHTGTAVIEVTQLPAV